MEEVAKKTYIGGSNKAQEGEDEGVDRDHFGSWWFCCEAGLGYGLSGAARAWVGEPTTL